MSRWICGVCGYIYDEEKEGTPFRELPESWACPLCRAGKRAFSRKTEEAARALAPAAPYRGQTRGLGAGELAAVCSNLARGCEKQYRDREAALFRELADYFTAAVPPVPEAGTEKLLELVRILVQRIPDQGRNPFKFGAVFGAPLGQIFLQEAF